MHLANTYLNLGFQLCHTSFHSSYFSRKIGKSCAIIHLTNTFLNLGFQLCHTSFHSSYFSKKTGTSCAIIHVTNTYPKSSRDANSIIQKIGRIQTTNREVKNYMQLQWHITCHKQGGCPIWVSKWTKKKEPLYLIGRVSISDLGVQLCQTFHSSHFSKKTHKSCATIHLANTYLNLGFQLCQTLFQFSNFRNKTDKSCATIHLTNTYLNIGVKVLSYIISLLTFH